MTDEAGAADTQSERSQPCVTSASLLVIGDFRLIAQGRLVWLSLPAQRLIAYLAVKGGERPRVEVARALWPGRADSSRNINLRQAIFQTRRTGHQLVGVTRHALWLASSVEVDLKRALVECGKLSAGGHELDPSLFGDDLLPTWRDSWLTLPRRSFRLVRLNVLEAVVETSLRAGDRTAAIDLARLIVAAEPSREKAQALLADTGRTELGPPA
jgi:DNA-binding SARP family transcriptional activator